MVLCGTLGIAQSFIITFPNFASAPTANPRNLIVCQNTSELQVQMDVLAASSTGAAVTIQLGTGVEYVPGSVSVVSSIGGLTISENGGTANAPQFQIGPNALAVSNRIVFSIKRRATCASRTHALGGGTFLDTVTGTIPGQTTSTANSSSYTVDFPDLSITPVTLPLNNAVVGGTYSREFAITNGSSICASTIYFTVDYPKISGVQAIVPNSLKITKWGNITLGAPITLTALSTTSTASSTTMLYSLSGTQLPVGGLCNSSVTITENYTVKACSGANVITNYAVGYGCDSSPSSWCFTRYGSATISMATGVPNLTGFTAARSNYTTPCNTFNATLTWTNGGTGVSAAATMFNVRFRANTAWSMLNIQSVNIGGQNVPFSIDGGGNATFDVTGLFSADPDGAGVGLDDIDGDGFFDDLAPGKTATILLTLKIDCSLYACGSNRGIGSFQGLVIYNQMCSPTVNTASPGIQAITGSNLNFTMQNFGSSSYAPANVSSGVPFKARFGVTNSNYVDSFLTPDSRHVYTITLPAGLSLVGTPTSTVWHYGKYPQNLSATTPLATITQTGNVVTVTAPASTNIYSINIGWIELDLVYNCSVGPGGQNVNIPFTFKVIHDPASGCECSTLGSLVCSNLVLANVLCPPPSCSTGGPSVSTVTVEREDNSLGWTDTTLATIQSRSAISAYDLSKALYLDDFFIKANAVMNGTATNNLHLYLSILKVVPGTDNKIQPKTIDVIIKRGGATVYSGSVSVFSNSGSTNSLQVTDWDISSVLPSGGLLPGDIIETISHYSVIAGDGLLPTNDVQTGEKLYFYSLDGSNNQIYCGNQPTPEMYLVGTTFEDNTTTISAATGCNVIAPGAGTDWVSRRFDTQGLKYLKEIRPGFLPTTMSLTLDPTYVLDKLEFVDFLTNTAGTTTILTPTSVVGNTYNFNIPNNLGYEILVTNFYNFRIRPSIRPTCSSPATNAIVAVNYQYLDYYYHYKNVVPQPPLKTGGRTISQAYNINTRPAITLVNQTGNIQASKPQHSFTVRMSSTGTNMAPYTWLAIPNAAGVDIQQVVDIATGTTLTPITYFGGIWFKISVAGLASGTYQDFRIDFKYTTCAATTFPIEAGWNCTEYPTDPSTYTCGKSTANLTFTPQSASIQIAAVTQPTNANLCDTSTYRYRVSSTGPGNTVGNKFNITLPTGMSIVPGTAQVEYPLGSGNWQNVSTTVNSNVKSLNLTTHPNYDSVNGLPGTLNDGGNSNLRFMEVRFDVLTDCTFVSGSRLVVSANAKKTCGEPAVGDGTLLNASSLTINGVAPTYYVTTAISQSPNSFTNCNVSTITIDHTIVTSTSTGSSGSIEVFIPQGYTYDSSSFNCTSTYCPTYIGTFTDTASGNQYLKYSIPAGMTTSQTMSYSMSFTPTNAVICGDKTLLVRTVDEFTGIACATAPGGTCGSITTETGYKEYNYTVTKPTLDIVSVSGSNSGGTYSGSITIKNTSTVNQTASSPSNPVKINFYCADDAGNATGQLLGTYTLTGSIVAGATITENYSFTGVVCTTGTRVFAAVETSNNCVCSGDRNTLFCFKPSLETGTALETKHGITALGRAGSDNSNWPMIRKGAWTALEANTKGFVLNRLTDAQVAAIPASNLVIGMTVYNITQDCLMINTTGTASGWKCLRNQGCPDW